MPKKDSATRLKRGRGKVERGYWGYLFILPFFIVYFMFTFFPLISTFYYSTTNYFKIDLMYYGPESVGLENFKNILVGQRSDELKGAFLNTSIMWLINFIPQMGMALLLAAWFTNARVRVKGQGVYKFFLYLPNIITASSLALLFKTLFGVEGPVNIIREMWNEFGHNAGFISEEAYASFSNFKFMDDPWSVRLIIAFINWWMWYGHTMIVLIAGILGISPSLFEAAQIDGANGGQIFRKITLPLLRPIMVYTLITSLIGGLQMFDIPALINILGENAKTTYDKAVTVVQLISYYSGRIENYGIASAISIVLFAVTGFFGIIIFYILRDKDEIAMKKAEKKAARARKRAMSGGAK